MKSCDKHDIGYQYAADECPLCAASSRGYDDILDECENKINDMRGIPAMDGGLQRDDAIALLGLVTELLRWGAGA